MKRKIIKETIFSKLYDSEIADIKFGDLPNYLQDDDIIEIESNSVSDTTELTIFRKRLENDEEFNNRCTEHEKMKQLQLNIKYNQYLKLKEELEMNNYKI